VGGVKLTSLQGALVCAFAAGLGGYGLAGGDDPFWALIAGLSLANFLAAVGYLGAYLQGWR
jgi:hypothetical protein